MAAESPAIVLAGLTKYYGRRRGVEDLTFEVRPGEVFGFLGPNGAGKTTTLRMLVGLLRLTAGSATVLGQDIASAPPALRARIGYLPGALALYKNLTGREFLTFSARMRRLDLDARITDLARRLDLDLDRHIHDLSRGNQQKIGVVQAFMHDPDVLILDEPTSGLDPIVQREFESLVTQATDRGAAVLLSSHVLSEVEQLAQRVAVVDDGRLLVVEHIETLKGRAVRTVELAFPAPVDAAAYEALPCVQQARVHGSQLTCTVVGAETDLLRLAVDGGVETVRTLEPSLEDIFMSLVAGGDLRAAPPSPQDMA
jgi:ABC-2 type transport system ATP-binding protein